MTVHALTPKRKKIKSTTVTPAKAKKILKDKTIKGKPLTKKQKGLFGAKSKKK